MPRKKYCGQFAICLTRFFLTDIFICSFNRNTIERCTNTKVFCIMTTANATKIHVFQDKCAILWLVKSPNSQVKFKCDASSVRFPAKFVAFCMFLVSFTGIA